MSSYDWTLITFLVDWLIRLGLSVRVIMRRKPVGVSLAWLSILLLVPLIGGVLYLFLGELRLGRKRAERAAVLHEPYREWLQCLSSRHPMAFPDCPTVQVPELATLIQNGADIPPLPANTVEILDHYEKIFQAMIAEIDHARESCHLEFYIWYMGGWADEVVDALVRASGRGVTCRILLDAVGSKDFLQSPQADRLRRGGVVLRAALPVNAFRMLFVRADLRLHRKIVVIDGQVAYTGSQNLVDPRYFKQGAGVGEWVDAMVRIQGPAVEPLQATFFEDWDLETGEDLLRNSATSIPVQPDTGTSIIQVFPSGPNLPQHSMTIVLLTALYAARRELILTTPYFVPDESMLMALASAALRGVEVTLIVPAKNDSKLVDLASRAFEGDLAAAGVRIMLFEGGLLHTKSITVDGEFSLFGSLNLDPRSLQLNFEITLAVYDTEFTSRLRNLQDHYIAESTQLDLDTWRARSPLTRFAENAARLVGPLL